MRGRWAIVVAGIATAALALALRGVETQTRPQAAPAGRPLNVLLVTLDTTRADRLGCYGYAKAATPTLDALAAGGLRFEHAFTHVPLTLPSHATILTSLRPPEHGLHDNGRAALGGTAPTLADLLRERNYRTGAFVSSFVLDRQFGLERGFDAYDDEMTSSLGTDNQFDQENRADVVTGRALAWLEQNTVQPFFCWVHYYDPHQPYDPPEPYRSQFEDPYDGEIAFVDANLRSLIDFLERTGQRDNTLVIVCGDHGEAFGEHQEEGHGALVYEPTMRVPLIVNLPGRIPAGRAAEHAVGLVDIAATVFDVLGWQRPAGVNGCSLVAEDVPSSRGCYGESEFLFNSHGWAPLYSLTTRHWRFIECPKPELYDRLNDAGETRNLAEDKPAVLAELRTQLAAVRAVMREGEAAAAKLDEHAVAVLRQLGYLGGPIGAVRRPTTEPATLRDPKAMMAVFKACREARELIDKGGQRQAILLLAPLVARSPESREIHSLLAEAHLALDEHAEARPHVEACLASEGDDRTMLANLGEILLATRKYDEVVRTFQQVLRLPQDPREPVGASGVSRITVKARVSIATALMEQKKPDDAAEQLRLVLEAEPGHAEANNNLANIYAFQGNNALAIQHYRKALEGDPKTYGAALNLGMLLCKEKQVGAAIAAWRDALRYRPEDAGLLQNLAWRLATSPEAACRDGREAARLGEALCKATQWSSAEALDTYGAALAESGEFEKAIEMARNALTAAQARSDAGGLVAQIEKRLALYRARKAYHEP